MICCCRQVVSYEQEHKTLLGSTDIRVVLKGGDYVVAVEVDGPYHYNVNGWVPANTERPVGVAVGFWFSFPVTPLALRSYSAVHPAGCGVKRRSVQAEPVQSSRNSIVLSSFSQLIATLAALEHLWMIMLLSAMTCVGFALCGRCSRTTRTGSTVLRDRLLGVNGFAVLPLPYWEIPEQVAAGKAGRLWLEKRLRQAAATPPRGKAGAPSRVNLKVNLASYRKRR